MLNNIVWRCLGRCRNRAVFLLLPACFAGYGVTVSKAVSFETVFLGDWLVEKTHDMAQFMRESGKAGNATAIAAPLDREYYKNSAFVFACVNERYYLDIEIPGNMRHGDSDANNIEVEFDSLDMLSSKSTLFQSGVIENGMLKVLLLPGFFEYFTQHYPTSLVIESSGNRIDYVYKNADKQKAIQAFKNSCDNG